ncbi:MOSC domain-containing protein [Luteipulveratus mongoliensis]|uniref:MOSC domain-containing protein n=1 Tax=Luteipulveratus mongoliensis TaxID=571913 RepID=A0A0K1JRE3_9MICO|nr:MOSC N-terminal beta barrel domain-containing protein [Luteipulveratus mongoliensis]AKU19163.1 hypothetical protein VV02_20810 [Luteipulveratus mongoliensis]
MKLSAINIHPIKSTAIRPVREAYVGRAGLRGDREWMIIDGAGVLITAREMPVLFGIRADTPQTDPTVESALRLRADGAPDLTLDLPAAPRQPVRLHKNDLEATPVGAEADAWVRQVLGRDDARLMWCDDPTRRSLNPEYTRPGDHAAFQDSSPISLTSTTSLEQLNEWLAKTAADVGEPAPEPLPMQRFRPNVVIEGVEEAFAEDEWSGVRIGATTFRVPKPIDRCVMTTIDPDSLAKGKEPIRTLARHRRWDGKTWFAVRLLPDTEGMIHIGDEVVLI